MSFAQLEEAAKQQMQDGGDADEQDTSNRMEGKRGSTQKGAAGKKAKPAVP